MKIIVLLAIYILSAVNLHATVTVDLSDDPEFSSVLGDDFSSAREFINLIEYEEILSEYHQARLSKEEDQLTDLDRNAFIPFDLRRSDIATAAILSTAAVMVFNNDQEVMSFVQENRTEVTEVVSEYGESFGSNLTIYGTGTGLIVGVVLDNDKVKRVSLMAAKSMLVSGLVTRVLKTSFGRHRPNEDETKPYQFEGLTTEHHSFPSGHTTQAFAFATVMAEEFKETKLVPIMAYSAAAIAGWSRVHGTGDGSPAHWGSDVIVGAMIGHIVAKQAYNSKLARRGIMVTPSYSRATGTSFNLRFEKRPVYLDRSEDYCAEIENSFESECEGSVFGY